MGGGNSTPSTAHNCDSASLENDCVYTLHENSPTGGWKHKICGATTHTEGNLSGASALNINKKGCLITLYGKDNQDGEQVSIEAITDGESFELAESPYGFSDRTRSYTTDYIPPAEEFNFSFDEGGGGGIDKKWIVIGVAVVVIGFLLMKKQSSKKSATDEAMDMLRDIRKDFDHDTESEPPQMRSPANVIMRNM